MSICVKLTVVCTATVLLIVLSWTSLAAEPSTKKTKSSSPDSSMTMQGGQEGTVFKDLVVEGEDLIRIEFDRPKLHIDVDPQSAPGLEWGSIQDVLDRNKPDLVLSLLRTSAREHSVYFARPWLDQFASNEIARFRPQVEGVDHWQLIIANSRGETVARFEGNGKPPKEIGWNGLSQDGNPVPPGLTYSYVLEAFDRAGNKRSFVGEGFELPSYRLKTPEGLVMLFSGREMSATDQRIESVPPAILLEVASRINQSEQMDQPVRVEVTARSFDRAKRLSGDIAQILEPLILRGPARIQSITNVEPDAPGDGSIQIVVPR
jgi:hypothetical protein